MIGVRSGTRRWNHVSRGFATDQVTSPNCPTRASPFMETRDCTQGATLIISLARLHQWNRKTVQSGLTGEDNDWFLSQFWEFSQSSIVRIRLDQADQMERPPLFREGEGVRRSIRLYNLEA